MFYGEKTGSSIIEFVTEAESESDPPSSIALTDDQRKHLDFIQAVVARLSSLSATMKGLTLTVTTFVYGFAATQGVPEVTAVGFSIVVPFAFLDAHYLREERLFRLLYADAHRGKVEVYSMDKDAYSALCSKVGVFFSWSVFGFYGPLILLGIGMLVWLLLG